MTPEIAVLWEGEKEVAALRSLVNDMREYIHDTKCYRQRNQAGTVWCATHEKHLPCEWPKVRASLKAMGFE